MDGFLVKTQELRRRICEEAEAKMNLPAVSLEKDFWVCWILSKLYSIPEWNQNLTFKGGTSLSKCWDLISRFSEDIDIVIDKGFLGFGGTESPEEAPSNKQKKKRLKNLKHIAHKRIHEELAPLLAEKIESTLRGSDNWELTAVSITEDPDGQTLLFRYPSALDGGKSYIRRVVKIEMGARSDNEPLREENIHPYLFDVFPDILGPGDVRVRALAPERTFWEKAMLLHEENFRPSDKLRKPRMARHYYDLWCLIGKGIGDRAVKRHDIFERTAVHRQVYFRWTWMDYSTLKKGKLRIVPEVDQEAEWRRDYGAMQNEMFYGYVPSFDEVLQVVSEFEQAFNRD
ncbi:MAG: hypothetical protein B1H09_01565 [Gemmatimonadaceae bacterium 4484_173]|nr:MAG: hypothetical protein B1H09_01565 [Gemmatimonadaceae bacterium 4484_173]